MDIEEIEVDGVLYNVDCEVECDAYEAPSLYSQGCGGASVRLISAKVEATGELVTDTELFDYIERCCEIEANERYNEPVIYEEYD